MRRFSSQAARLAVRRVSAKAQPRTAPVQTPKITPAPASAAPKVSTPTPEPVTKAVPPLDPVRSVPNLPEPDLSAPERSNPTLDVIDSESLNEDWATSFQGLGSKPFEPRVVDIVMAPVVPEDVEITPDGLLYLPEIKYRRILNRAFGPGGWGIAPRTKTLVTKRQVTREYGLVCLGRLVSVSRGEMDYFSAEGVTTAMEGCKSNALMRCCKDLGIASELWDPAFIRQFKQKHCESKFFEKKKRFVWKRKDRQWEYPYI